MTKLELDVQIFYFVIIIFCQNKMSERNSCDLRITELDSVERVHQIHVDFVDNFG